MSTPMRPSPLSFDSAGRQSPFKRQNSQSPATNRATTPTHSPTKPNNPFSPTKTASLSPEKTSPFVRRPSQISQSGGERPASPFARPSSSFGRPASPARQDSRSDDTPPPASSPSRSRGVTPALEDEAGYFSKQSHVLNAPPSPSPFDGSGPASSPVMDSPSISTAAPSQANLRPVAQRTMTSSTTSTLKQPIFNPPPRTTTTPNFSTTHNSTNTFNGGGGGGGASSAYKNVPQPLFRSMRESFEVLDANNTGTINSAAVAQMLEQMGLPHNATDLQSFFPTQAPSNLNLARYLDTLSTALADLSPPEELLAAFAAFDVDDSGQIDVAELRKALLDTAPGGEEMIRLGEGEVDGILGAFAGRRAFGAKGVNVAKGKGEVFRHRDFMAGITGGSGDIGGVEVGVEA